MPLHILAVLSGFQRFKAKKMRAHEIGGNGGSGIMGGVGKWGEVYQNIICKHEIFNR